VIAALLLSAVAAAAPARPSVVLVTLDTTRADHLGCYGAATAATPVLDALAAAGARFDQALSPVPLTLPAHASLMSGLVPRRHGVRDNAGFELDAGVTVLAERFKAAGYDTAAFVSAAVLDRAGGLARGFDLYDDSVRVGDRRAFDYEERAASQMVDAALPKIAALKAPFFVWLHFYDPHLPYVPPEPYAARFKGSPYDGEIAFMDAQIGRALAAIKKKGTAVVVVAGDHGESLGEHGESTHGVFLYQATQRVPLIIGGPGVPPSKAIGRTVGLIDVAPTILELAGLAPLAGTDGRSLVALMRGTAVPARDYELETYYPAYSYGWAPLRGLVSGPMKYIEAPRPELYDLPKDPHERHDLASSSASRLGALARTLTAVAGPAVAAVPSDDPDDEERRAKLAALGYAGGSAPPAAGGLDPKDGVKLLPELDAARRALQLGDPKDALPPLGRLLAANPTNVPAMLLLGQVQLATGKVPEAIATYERVAATAPENALAWFDLGNAYAAAGPKDDAAFASAKAAYDRSLALSPRHADTYMNYAVLLAARRRPSDARALLLRARSAGVQDPTIEAEIGVLELANKDAAAAKSAFERSLALNPRQAESLEGMGKLAYAEGDAAGAASFYARALAAHPTVGLAKTLGAIRLYELHDKAGAKDAFAKALALSGPGDPDAAELRSLIADLSK
jgi:arylsulfatase A-like enzyme/Tfp pilus assembly protein PilF